MSRQGVPYVYPDATYVHVCDDALGQVVSGSIAVATVVTVQGGREVLGGNVGDAEGTSWTTFLDALTRWLADRDQLCVREGTRTGGALRPVDRDGGLLLLRAGRRHRMDDLT